MQIDGEPIHYPNVGAARGYNCTDLFNPNPHDPWNGSITRNDNPTNLQTSTRSA